MKLEVPPIENLLIKTRRMELEPITDNHAPDLVQLFSDNNLHTYVPLEPPTLEEQKSKCERWAKRISPKGDEIWLNWAARCLINGRIIGHFQSGYKLDKIATIGYVVAKDMQGKGLAFEALSEIFSYLRYQAGVSEIRALSDTRNTPSHGLALKLGMKRIETTKNADFFKGTNSDECVFSIKFS